jgi:hypothetical protein
MSIPKGRTLQLQRSHSSLGTFYDGVELLPATAVESPLPSEYVMGAVLESIGPSATWETLCPVPRSSYE